MSGIAGYIGKTVKAEETLLLRMADAMHQRGPDDSGIFLDRNVGFAHTRLAVVDLGDNGHQTFQSPDGRFVPPLTRGYFWRATNCVMVLDYILYTRFAKLKLTTIYFDRAYFRSNFQITKDDWR